MSLDVSIVRSPFFSVGKDDGPLAVDDDAVLEEEMDRARKDPALDVAPLPDQIFRRVAVADAFDVLFDDRTFVEIARRELRGGPDDLHAARVRLVIGLGSLESRQEAVMDVDAAALQMAREIVREDLHVAREDDKIR